MLGGKEGWKSAKNERVYGKAYIATVLEDEKQGHVNRYI